VRRTWLVAAAAALPIVGWAALILAVPQFRFVILAPRAKTGFEVFLALLQLFAALVLFLFPGDAERLRLRWVALGFVVLGIGGLVFGYALPVLARTHDLGAAMYGSLVTHTVAGAAMALGLMLPRPPTLSGRAGTVATAAFALVAFGTAAATNRLPPLVVLASLEEAVNSAGALRGLGTWHWPLSALPLAGACAAAAGAARRCPGQALGGWVLVAMVLLAGSQVHTLFWPSAYSPIVTTASLLRLGATAVVASGAFFELRRVAGERAALLAVEREYSARLADVARLRADFTRVIAHEFGNRLAAVRQANELLATGSLNSLQRRALATLEVETTALAALVADVQATAAAERGDLAVRPRPVLADALLADAATFAWTLPGDHPVTIEGSSGERVLADPDRVGQVLRNLLCNAAKYSPPGAPIQLRTTRRGRRLRIEVIDHGYGIPPDDLARVFEKFGRGRYPLERKIPGAGLGLYLSRGIVQAHGAELAVASAPGRGTVVGFELEVAA